MRDRRRERLVRVAVADNMFTAEFLRDRLKEAGIPSTMRNREGGAAVVGGIAGTFELFVLEGDADLAAAVIGDGTPPESLPPPSLPAARPRTRRRRWWR
jgi:hypothetical protein